MSFACGLGVGFRSRYALSPLRLAPVAWLSRAGTSPGGNFKAGGYLRRNLLALAEIGHKLGGGGWFEASLDKGRRHGAGGALGGQEPFGKLDIGW